MSLIVSNEATPATPVAGTTELFVNASKQLSTIDDVPTTRVFDDLTSANTLTNKTLSSPVITGTVTGTATFTGAMTLSAPTLSGVVTGTYTLSGAVTLASQATTPYVADATGAGSKKVASGGPVALITGTKVVATGLATVSGFVVSQSTQPTGTGTASHQILAVTSITTGAVTVTAYSVSSVTGATIAASTSTGSFYWFAMGT